LIFFIKKERASPFASSYENNGTEIDPEKRWIRILDDYLQRIKYFFDGFTTGESKNSKD
jgi:hypothetical protein